MISRLGRWFVITRAGLSTALRGMATNRLRAFLSMLGVAIGVATLTAIVAIVQGLSSSFAEQIGALGANTLYVSDHPWVIRGDWWKYRNRPNITRTDELALRDGADLLLAIAPMSFSAADISYLGESGGTVNVRGTNEDYFATASYKIDQGRFLSVADVELGRAVVVLGAEVKTELFRGADPTDARVRLGGEQFTVIGVLKAQGSVLGQSMDNHVIVPITRFGRMFGTKRGLAIAVVAPPEQLDAAEEQIVEVLRRSRGLRADEEENFSVNRQSQLAKMFTEETTAIFGVAVAIGLITLLVGGIGVMNIMLVAVTERTREIGVRRALGARRRTILVQFLAESSLVTIVGGAVGMILGMGGAKIMALMTPVAAQVTPEAVIGGLVFSATVGLVFGTWPAYRAATLDPIESLRYE